MSKDKKNISGYGSGSVDVVLSVDEVAKQAAKISSSGVIFGIFFGEFGH